MQVRRKSIARLCTVDGVSNLRKVCDERSVRLKRYLNEDGRAAGTNRPATPLV